MISSANPYNVLQLRVGLQVNEPFKTSDILNDLIAGKELGDGPMRWMFTRMLSGHASDINVAAFLVALRTKGETASDIALAAKVLREHMIPWDCGDEHVLDTCGTGGDGSGTFNISTAAALVVAACGVRVVKHGNRSVSSKFGSADVLAALGVKIDGDAEHARRTLRETNFAFCFAPQFHPALKHLSAVRRELGISTIFNCLGPLANPAGAARQVIGAGRRELLEPMAGALARLGTVHAFVLHSEDGLDEVSLNAPTMVREVRGDRVSSLTWTSADFGLKNAPREELFAPNAEASAGMIGKVLAGEESAAYRIVLANAAAALVAADQVRSLRDGVAQAREAIESGRGQRVLETLRRLNNSVADA